MQPVRWSGVAVDVVVIANVANAVNASNAANTANASNTANDAIVGDGNLNVIFTTNVDADAIAYADIFEAVASETSQAGASETAETS